MSSSTGREITGTPTAVSSATSYTVTVAEGERCDSNGELQPYCGRPNCADVHCDGRHRIERFVARHQHHFHHHGQRQQRLRGEHHISCASQLRRSEAQAQAIRRPC